MKKTPLNFLQAGRTAGPEQRRGQCEDGMNINGGESDVKKKNEKIARKKYLVRKEIKVAEVVRLRNSEIPAYWD